MHLKMIYQTRINANKSFELSDDDAPTIKESYQEEKIKEIKALLKKSDQVWTCKSCGYSNKQNYLATLQAKTHVKALMFHCKYCPKVYSRKFSLRSHTHKKHRNERKQKTSILENKRQSEQEERGSLENKDKGNKNNLDKEIDEKVGNLRKKMDIRSKCGTKPISPVLEVSAGKRYSRPILTATATTAAVERRTCRSPRLS